MYEIHKNKNKRWQRLPVFVLSLMKRRTIFLRYFVHNFKKRLQKTITKNDYKNDATRRIEIYLNLLAIKHVIINLNIKILTNIQLRLHLQRKDVPTYWGFAVEILKRLAA